MKKCPKVPMLKPGDFVYYAGMVFEIDNRGARRRRPDIKPETNGAFKNKYFIKDRT